MYAPLQVGAVKSILGLLGHENLDVAVTVVELLQELTDTDALEDEEDHANAMIECLVKIQVLISFGHKQLQ